MPKISERDLELWEAFKQGKYKTLTYEGYGRRIAHISKHGMARNYFNVTPASISRLYRLRYAENVVSKEDSWNAIDIFWIEA